jgi:hypothetical protein
MKRESMDRRPAPRGRGVKWLIAVAALAFPAAARADWVDGGPPSAAVVAHDGWRFNIASPDATYHDGPDSAYFVVQVFDTRGKKVEFSAEWVETPVTRETCESAVYVYSVGHPHPTQPDLWVGDGGGGFFGVWTNLFGSEFCHWQAADGPAVVSIPDAPANTYRVYVQAGAGGQRKRVGAVIWTNFSL